MVKEDYLAIGIGIGLVVGRYEDVERWLRSKLSDYESIELKHGTRIQTKGNPREWVVSDTTVENEE